MAVVNARRTHGSRIIKIDLSESELGSMRLMLSDPSLTDVYIRTEQYDGEPAALLATADVEAARFDRRRLDAALERIGHQGSPGFRARLAAAYELVA